MKKYELSLAPLNCAGVNVRMTYEVLLASQVLIHDKRMNEHFVNKTN